MVRPFAPLPHMEGGSELLDGHSGSSQEIRQSLLDLERLNERFGGVRTILLHLRKMTGESRENSHTILDVATGAADIPRAICRWARGRGMAVAVEAADWNEQILGAAAEWSADYPEITFRRIEAPRLPYPDRSFDYVISSLFLHHLTWDQTVSLLREMKRTARCGIIANDLRRSRSAKLLTRMATSLLSSNRLTRHDGPISVTRSWRPAELRSMARQAGLAVAQVHFHPWFRMALVERVSGD